MALIKNGAPSVDSVTGALLTQAVVPGSSTGVAASQHITSAASVNATELHVGAAAVTFFTALNTSAAQAYVRLYNKATAPVAADVPLVTLAIPAHASVTLPLAVAVNAGLALDITAAAPDNDQTAVAAGDVILTVFWTA